MCSQSCWAENPRDAIPQGSAHFSCIGIGPATARLTDQLSHEVRRRRSRGARLPPQSWGGRGFAA
jgi:hypothetical protein